MRGEEEEERPLTPYEQRLLTRIQQLDKEIKKLEKKIKKVTKQYEDTLEMIPDTEDVKELRQLKIVAREKRLYLKQLELRRERLLKEFDSRMKQYNQSLQEE